MVLGKGAAVFVKTTRYNGVAGRCCPVWVVLRGDFMEEVMMAELWYSARVLQCEDSVLYGNPWKRRGD